MPRPTNQFFYIRNWRIVILREEKELVLINPRNKILTICRTTKTLNGLPYFVIEGLFFSGLIPDYLRY